MSTTVNLPIPSGLSELYERSARADGQDSTAGTGTQGAGAAGAAQAARTRDQRQDHAAGAAALARHRRSARILRTTRLVVAALVLGAGLVVAAATPRAAARPLAGLRPLAAAPPEPAPAAPVPALRAAPALAEAATAGAPAEDPAANAALLLWRAFDALPAATDPIWTIASTWRDSLPDPTVDACFARPSRSLALLALAGSASYCEWGPSPAVNAGGQPPQVSKLRKLLELGVLRARWLAARGQTAAAVDDLLACLRCARLAGGRQPLLIEYLTCTVCESHALQATAALLPQLDAAQRRRLATQLAGLPSSAGVAESLARERDAALDQVRLWLSLPLGERHRRLPDIPPDLAVHGLHDPVLPTDTACDASLQAFLEQYPLEVARWQQHARLPLAERIAPITPTYSSGALPPHPLMTVLAPGLQELGHTEVSLLIQRQQLLAALAVIDQGEADLAAYPDPLSGQPFRYQATREGFRLLADLPGYQQGVLLVVGEAAALHAGGAGRGPAATAPPAPLAPHPPRDENF